MEEVLELKNEGFTIMQIAEKLGVSRSRVANLLKDSKNRLERDEDPLYILMRKAANSLRYSEHIANVAYWRLIDHGVYTVQDLRDLDLDWYLTRSYVGNAQIEIIRRALRYS